MAWLRLFGGVTRMDLLVGVLGTALVEWAGLLALSQPEVGESSIGTAATTFSVPVRIVEAPRPEAAAGRLALGGGGGKGGGRAAGSEATTATAHGTSRGTRRVATQRERTAKKQQATNPGREKKRAISFETGTKNPEAPTPNEAAEAVEGEGSEVEDAGWDDPGSATGGDGDGIGAQPFGEGFPEGSIGGTITDPLVARAIQLYRERFSAWLATRFRVKGSALSKAELSRIKVRAVVHIDEQRRVAGYSITPSGNRAFDEAAHAALRSVTGLEIPPLPSRYPGPVQQQIRVTFVCPEDACD